MTSATSPSKPYPRRGSGEIIRPSFATEWQKPLSKQKIAQLQHAGSEDAWLIWCEHLAQRKKIAPLSKLFPDSKSPLSWSVDISLQRDETLAFIRVLGSRRKSKKSSCTSAELLSDWSATSETDVCDSADAVRCVITAWALPALSQSIKADLWWRILNRLVLVAADALQLDLEKQPLAANLVGGELPLAMAYLFPELKSTAALAKLAIEFLDDSMVQMLDGEGMPKACFLPLFGPLLGCWTRCRAIMKQRPDLSWSAEAENQYLWLLTQAVRLSRGRGGFAFAPRDNLASDRDLLRTAVEQFGNRSDRLAAKAVLGRKAPKRNRAIDDCPAYHSEWATVGVLRSKFDKKSRQLGVTYADNHNRIELSYGNRILFTGDIASRTVVNSETELLHPSQAWEEVAWESDDHVDYLEIETRLNNGTKLQRGFLLSRKDHFLLLADSLLCGRDDKVQHQIQLPLGAGMTVDKQENTWELLLKAPQPLARILPIALPEWKQCSHQGKLTVNRRAIILEQKGAARLFVPLFIDLSSKRTQSRLTWRQLSVGERRKNIPSHIAAGFRVHIGQAQWLIYRSLEESIPRTVLGQNLLCDYHVSRFLKSGTVEPLIEIQ